MGQVSGLFRRYGCGLSGKRGIFRCGWRGGGGGNIGNRGGGRLHAGVMLYDMLAIAVDDAAVTGT